MIYHKVFDLEYKVLPFHEEPNKDLDIKQRGVCLKEVGNGFILVYITGEGEF